jgi:1,2-phenylacetyl-CoA epoxidase PaaB subunit
VSAKKDSRWKIYNIKSTPAKFIGSVTAPDEEAALKKAISELEIDPKIRNRIVAMRQG